MTQCTTIQPTISPVHKDYINMSSLQRAAVDAGRIRKQEDVGSFESRFAGGLDFSELPWSSGNSAARSATGRSAAAELLRARREENRQKAGLELEDQNLQKSIQKKLKRAEKSSDAATLPLRAPPPSSASNEGNFLQASSGLTAALCSMHSNDKTEQRLKTRRTLAKAGLNNRRTSRQTALTSKNRRVVKKRQQRKI